MTDSVYPIDVESLSIGDDAGAGIGRKYAERYQSATPYNHICLDGFLPEPVADRVLADVDTLEQEDAEASFDRAQEKLKFSYNPEALPEYSRNLFRAFNASPFVRFLEEMTGISGLIPDPYYVGAGIHKTLNGGHLDIHADFNVHKKMQLERRLNVLIYLNRGWQAEWGGSFEIWDKAMTMMEASFEPLFNRMVCFSTGSDTYHGNPEPVNHPEGQPRLSIALYYYTATWDSSRKAHTTLFKSRPGTTDAADRKVARRAFVRDLTPPIIYRRIAGPLSRIGF